jgi:hypothetical protein
MNRKGQVVVAPAYDEAYDFHEGRAAVGNRYLWTDPVHTGTTQLRSRCGYIDLSGKLVIPLQYADASPFRQGRARVRTGYGEQDQKYGFIDPCRAAGDPAEVRRCRGFFGGTGRCPS